MAQLKIVTGETAVCVPIHENVLLSEVLRDHGKAPAMPCAGHGCCGKCRVIASGALSAPSPAEQAHLTIDEFARGIRLACCTRLEGDCQVILSDRTNSQICLSGVMDAVTLCLCVIKK